MARAQIRVNRRLLVHIGCSTGFRSRLSERRGNGHDGDALVHTGRSAQAVRTHPSRVVSD